MKKHLKHIVLSALILIVLIVLAILIKPNLIKDYRTSSDDWRVVLVREPQSLSTCFWSGYLVCTWEQVPGEVRVCYMSRGLNHAYTYHPLNTDPPLPFWGSIALGNDYTALYPFVSLSPNMPEIIDCSITTPDGTVIYVPDIS